MGWQVSFRQAWRSFCNGSFPVGSALVGPDGAVIANGRNRIFDSGEDGLSGSLLAHAEVASLSRLPVDGRHDDVTLFSTLEPCLFCMGAILLSRVGTVRYGGADSYGGAARVPLDLNPQTGGYELRIDGPLEGPFGHLAATLPLVYLTGTDRWTRVVDHVRDVDPQLVDLAGEIGSIGAFRYPQFSGFAAALVEAWPAVSPT